MDKKDAEKVIVKLMQDNDANKELADSYDRGYFEGFHDACVDIMRTLEIETAEKYYN